ncbi:dialkylrecorsinol condensing enzyme [Aliarcobacter cryaerophilus]|uniref:dialkylrecorsinol condensing enzyme n=1 Tax=Aliarcobacter cryaerophilus TaxID=28198 RepID=UPI001D178FE3|nr:dialkylrecorsinol condensing enzyme [Aliarcobacter cryaerophilus]
MLSYSQTGQLNNLVENFTKPFLGNENFELIFKNIKPKKDYPFPWDFMTFMDTFPESVYMVPCELENIEDDENDYDLIILAYTVWFLSPSIPISSFLQSSYAKKKFKDKPVVTLIACRNMWIMAQEKIKKLLDDLSATLIDNVVLVDKGNSLETFITTPRWMLTGKKDSCFGLSSAGIDENEIIKSQRFGKALVQALEQNKEKEKKSLLQGLKAVEVDIKLIKSEKIGNKSFLIWGKLIRKIGNFGDKKRRIVVMLYLVFLILMILIVVPINMIVQTILRKLNKNSILKQKEFYELPSGSKDFKMKEFL